MAVQPPAPHAPTPDARMPTAPRIARHGSRESAGAQQAYAGLQPCHCQAARPCQTLSGPLSPACDLQGHNSHPLSEGLPMRTLCQGHPITTLCQSHPITALLCQRLSMRTHMPLPRDPPLCQTWPGPPLPGPLLPDFVWTPFAWTPARLGLDRSPPPLTSGRAHTASPRCHFVVRRRV